MGGTGGKVLRRTAWLVEGLVLLAAVAGWVGTVAKASGRRNGARSYVHLRDYNRPECRIGVLAGCDSETLGRGLFDRARVLAYDDFGACVRRLLAGKLDGVVFDEHVLRLVQFRHPGRLEMVEEPLDTDPSVVAVSARRPEVLAKLNAFIADYRSSGLYDEMFLRWCHDPERRDAEQVEPSGLNCPEASAPLLRVGFDPVQEPNAYVDAQGRVMGFDLEFAYRFGRFAGYRIAPVLRPEAELLALASAGELDVVVANLGRDEARQGLLWSDGYLDSDVKLLVRASEVE